MSTNDQHLCFFLIYSNRDLSAVNVKFYVIIPRVNLCVLVEKDKCKKLFRYLHIFDSVSSRSSAYELCNSFDKNYVRKFPATVCNFIVI